MTGLYPLRQVVTGLIAVFITLHSAAQQSKCPPLPIPLVNYQYQNTLHSGVGAELNLWFIAPKCDCNETFGALCYLFGTTAGLKLNYFPGTKAWDVSAAIGYRSLGILFLKPELHAGYVFMPMRSGPSFFHLDPAIGFDLAFAKVSFGYSFRAAEISGKKGAFTFQFGLSPLVLFGDSKTKKAINSVNKASLGDIKRVKKGR